MKIRIFISILIVFFSLISCNNNKNEITITNGVIDISDEDFINNKTINLKGEWEFYYKELLLPSQIDIEKLKKKGKMQYVNVPSGWTKYRYKNKRLSSRGYATYRVTINLESDKKVYMRIPKIGTAYRLWVNGELLEYSGRVTADETLAIPEYKKQILTMTPEKNKLEIVFNISNYNHREGGIREAIEIGYPKGLMSSIYTRNIIEIFAFGFLVIIGLYHIFLYILYSKNKETLYFSFFSMSILIQTVVGSKEMLFSLTNYISFNNYVQFDYMTIPLSLLFMMLFLYHLYPGLVNKNLLISLLSITGLLFLFTILSNSFIISSSDIVYNLIFTFYGILIIYYIFKATIRQKDEAFLLLFGSISIFIAALYDMFFMKNLSSSGYLIHFGAIIFFFSEAILIALKHTKIINTNESLSSELKVINRAYERFVPREFIELLSKKDIKQLSFGENTLKTMTIMFVNFKIPSIKKEIMTNNQYYNFITDYYRIAGPIIKKHSGFIDKYLGTEIMALFPDSANDAVKAAVEIRQAINILKKDLAPELHYLIDIGIGIHTGECVLGIIGESKRMETTVIADAVNLTNRLQGITKFFGSSLIISSTSYIQLEETSNFIVRFLGRVQVKGKQETVSVYEIITVDSKTEYTLMKDIASQFEEGLIIYYSKDFEKALSIFQKIENTIPWDKPLQYYIEKATFYNDSMIDTDFEIIEKFNSK